MTFCAERRRQLLIEMIESAAVIHTGIVGPNTAEDINTAKTSPPTTSDIHEELRPVEGHLSLKWTEVLG